MKQREGFAVKGKKELVCKLKRSLYGIKKSPRMWYQIFNIYILSLRFVRSKVDHYVYSKEEGDHFIYVVLHVDDVLLIGNNMDAINEVKKQLSSKFDTKDLGAMNLILGMEIKTDLTTIKLWLKQKKYIEISLKCFNMHDCKPVSLNCILKFLWNVSACTGAKLIAEQCPKTHEEIKYMAHVPYASNVGSQMYATVCTWLDIAHVVGALSKYMLTPEKEH
jgi:hypothetical protein